MDSETLEWLLQCPISLERMEDPVVVFPSGHSYDRKCICASLLIFPCLDPKSGVYYDKPLCIVTNFAMRSLLIDMDALVPYNDSHFANEYKRAWEQRNDFQHALQMLRENGFARMIGQNARLQLHLPEHRRDLAIEMARGNEGGNDEANGNNVNEGPVQLEAQLGHPNADALPPDAAEPEPNFGNRDNDPRPLPVPVIIDVNRLEHELEERMANDIVEPPALIRDPNDEIEGHFHWIGDINDDVGFEDPEEENDEEDDDREPELFEIRGNNRVEAFILRRLYGQDRVLVRVNRHAIKIGIFRYYALVALLLLSTAFQGAYELRETFFSPNVAEVNDCKMAANVDPETRFSFAWLAARGYMGEVASDYKMALPWHEKTSATRNQPTSAPNMKSGLVAKDVHMTYVGVKGNARGQKSRYTFVSTVSPNSRTNSRICPLFLTFNPILATPYC